MTHKIIQSNKHHKQHAYKKLVSHWKVPLYANIFIHLNPPTCKGGWSVWLDLNQRSLVSKTSMLTRLHHTLIKLALTVLGRMLSGIVTLQGIASLSSIQIRPLIYPFYDFLPFQYGQNHTQLPVKNLQP